MRPDRDLLLVLMLVSIILQIDWSGFDDLPKVRQVSGAPPYAVSGTINMIYSDGHGKGGETKYYLSTADGTRIRLSFTSRPSFAYFGKSVTVSGDVPSPIRQENGRVEMLMPVKSVALAAGQASSNVALGTVSGTRNMVILLLKYSDDASVPHDPTFYANLMNPASGSTVNAFYQANSWGLLSMQVHVTPNWMTMPHPKSYYANCGFGSVCADLAAISNDAIGLGLANGVNFANYDMISYALSNDLDCCAWGGSDTYTIAGLTKTYGVTWMPPWAQEVGAYSHEIGHSMGLPHSGWVYYDYDSPWDMMSDGDTYNPMSCGSYFSRNTLSQRTIYCYTPADTIAPYKDMLGWIDSSHLLTVTPGSTVTAELDSLAAPLLATSYKMVKLCITGYSCVSGGSTSRYLAIEARTHYGYDQYVPGEGVIIHMFQGDRQMMSGSCFFVSDSPPAYPIDSTSSDWDSNCSSGGRSYPGYALFNAQWEVGLSYSDPSILGNNVIFITSQSGSSPSPVTYVVTISSPIFDFSLTNSNAISLLQGGSGSNTIIVALLSGLSHSATLSCTSGLPSGASCSFDPSSSNPTFASTLTISTSSSTPAGSFRITVTGTDGEVSRATSFILLVCSGTLGQTFFHPNTEFWFSRYDMVNAQWDAIHIVNTGTGTATVQIAIGTVKTDSLNVNAGQATYVTYPGIVGGPVHITSNQPIWATQRILGWTAMQEIYGMPGDVPSGDIVFTWYDLVNANSDDIYIINPSVTQTASVDLYIAGVLRKGELSVAPGEAAAVSFPDVVGGPLRIFSTVPVFASQRVIGFGDFAEIIGLPRWYTFTETWFNWYDMQGAEWAAIHILNPGTRTANLNIYIGGLLSGSLSLTAGAADYRYFPGLIGGPVRVVSDQPIWVTQRIVGWGGWKEVFGVPTTLANTQWYMTWYDMQYAKWDAIHILNPSMMDAQVQVYVGGELRLDISVAADQAVYVTYPGLIAGPVRIFSTVPIMSSQRILGWGSFEETIGASFTT